MTCAPVCKLPPISWSELHYVDLRADLGISLTFPLNFFSFFAHILRRQEFPLHFRHEWNIGSLDAIPALSFLAPLRDVHSRNRRHSEDGNDDLCNLFQLPRKRSRDGLS